MQLKDCQDAYYEISGKASDISRQLAFAGIALIWIFRSESSPGIAVPAALLPAALALIIALGFDLLQYLWATGVWGLYHRQKEKQLGVGSTADFSAPRWFNWPTVACFWLKAFFVIWAFLLILQFIHAKATAI